MSEADWAEFEALVARCAAVAPTQARAHGLVLSGLLHAARTSRARARPTRLDGLGASQDPALARVKPKIEDRRRFDWMDMASVRHRPLRLLLVSRTFLTFFSTFQESLHWQP